MRVLRVSHSAVVDEWRGRERALTELGVDVALVCARTWHAGGAEVSLVPRPGERVTGARTFGRHPALFVYDPRPIWRALGEPWDVLDVHEEPFALATAEVLLLRALRRRRRGGRRGSRPPVVLYTAQNLRKRYPIPFRWFERRALRTAAGISACNAEAARIVEEKGFAGRARVIPLGVDLERFSPAGADAAGQADPATPAQSSNPGFLRAEPPEAGTRSRATGTAAPAGPTATAPHAAAATDVRPTPARKTAGPPRRRPRRRVVVEAWCRAQAAPGAGAGTSSYCKTSGPPKS